MKTKELGFNANDLISRVAALVASGALPKPSLDGPSFITMVGAA
jgi:hypothetical protein